MSGVQYLVDERGKPRAVQIDLKKHGQLWEDFQDLLVSESRRREREVTPAQLKSRLARPRKPR